MLSESKLRAAKIVVDHILFVLYENIDARIAQLVEHCTYEVNWPCKGLEFDSRYGHFLFFQLEEGPEQIFFFV